MVLFGGEGDCFQVLASCLVAEINKGQERVRVLLLLR
jgi:hypothetical protein